MEYALVCLSLILDKHKDMYARMYMYNVLQPVTCPQIFPQTRPKGFTERVNVVQITLVRDTLRTTDEINQVLPVL